MGFRTLVSARVPGTGATSALAGVVRRGGRDELVLTFDYIRQQTQFQLLAPGLIRWLTKGVHLGYDPQLFRRARRRRLAAQRAWDSENNCTSGVDCPDTV